MPVDITFIAWSDTHSGYEQRFGEADQRNRIARQINTLTGWPYPATVGGCIGPVAFVAHLGDLTEGGPPDTLQAQRDYYLHLRGQVRHPQYELLGNHDADSPMQDWFENRYHTPSYSFDIAGVRFIFLRVSFGPTPQSGGEEHITDDQLTWLKADLATVQPDTPVVLFVHSPIHRWQNAADALAILEPYNIVLSMAGHLHHQRAYEHAGITCVDVGQCRDHPHDPPMGRTINVVHLTDTHLTVTPWRWDHEDWERGQGWANAADYATMTSIIKPLTPTDDKAAPPAPDDAPQLNQTPNEDADA